MPKEAQDCFEEEQRHQWDCNEVDIHFAAEIQVRNDDLDRIGAREQRPPAL